MRLTLITSILIFAFQTKSQHYQGPIIDMHIHAYEQSPMFGMTHPPTLRGETFKSAINAQDLKQQIFAKFEEHNIVKALVTSGHLWFDDAPETILIGQSQLDDLQSQFENGRLHAVAELSPFYEGYWLMTLLSDISLRQQKSLGYQSVSTFSLVGLTTASGSCPPCLVKCVLPMLTRINWRISW